MEAWAAERRTEILQRAKHFSEKFQPLSAAGWSLRGCGAYFAFVEHPFEDESNILAPLILRDQGILLMPGTMFYPKHNPLGARSFRIAFANIDKNKISTLLERLKDLSYQRLNSKNNMIN